MVTFIFTILTITVIAVVIDTSEKTDDFVASGLSTWEIITNYYFGFVPFIISMIFPLIVFIAVIFFTSKLSGRSEIVAILANGVSFNRMLRPYFMGGLFLATILWLAMQFVIPKANYIYGSFKTTYVDKNSSYKGLQNSPDYYMRVDTNTFIGLRYYDTTYKSASAFFMEKVKGNQVFYNLRSSGIKWDTAKNKWRIDNGIERTFKGLNETVKKVDTMYLNLNILPGDLRRDEYLKDRLITPELDTYIAKEELRGSEGLNTLKVERYRRDATPFSVLILTIIGVVVSSRKTRGGSGMHLAIGIVIAALFVVMDKFSTVFSTKGDMHPLLAAWIPNMVFTVVAIYMYKKAPK